MRYHESWRHQTTTLTSKPFSKSVRMARRWSEVTNSLSLLTLDCTSLISLILQTPEAPLSICYVSLQRHLSIKIIWKFLWEAKYCKYFLNNYCWRLKKLQENSASMNTRKFCHNFERENFDDLQRCTHLRVSMSLILPISSSVLT